MKFVPLFDRVLIKPKENDKVKDMGFVLSGISKTRPTTGVVIAVGNGENLDYTKCKMSVCVGDKVEFNPYATTEIELDKEKYLVIRQIDIVGVYSEREDNC